MPVYILGEALWYRLFPQPILHPRPYRSGFAPTTILIDDLYRDLYGSWVKERPADMRTINALSVYRLAYSDNSYEVYPRAE
jgi:hypothetical protein